MVRLARARGLRVLLCTAPVDPRFRPPFAPACPGGIDGKAKALLLAGQPKRALALLDAAPDCRGKRLALWVSGTASERLGDDARARRDFLSYATLAAPSPPLFRDIERRVAREEGAILVDIEKKFSEGARLGLPDAKYFSDSHHLSALGYRVAAREIVKALADNGHASLRCPEPWTAPKPSGPYGLMMAGMERELGLATTYRSQPEMTLANVYSFYAGGSGDPWFEARARAWMADALRTNRDYVLRHLRTDNPVVARLLSDISR
jgi:hypothetical protein